MEKKIFSLLILFLLISCNKEETEPKDDKNDRSEILTKKFSKENMLIYLADYVIIPGYEDLAQTSSEMEEAIRKFTTSPSSSSLEAARESWLKTYIVWQKVSVTQVGKAKKINLTGKLNSYPTNTEKIENYIKSGVYDLSERNMRYSEGFPALDYLLNAPNEIASDDKIIELYKNNTKYKTYINDVSKEIKDLTILVRDDFKNDYRTKFIKKFKDNDISSIKQVTKYFRNNFLETQIHNNKISRPSGYDYSSISNPQKAEAVYKKDISKKLYLVALNAGKDFYNGKSYDAKETGHSIKQYLDFLNRKDLDNLVNEKFNDIIKVSDDLEKDFSAQIRGHHGKRKYENTSNELNKLLKLFEIDVFNAMGVDTNSDTDSDND